MKTLISYSLLGLVAVLFTSCASTITQPQPFPSNYQVKIKSYMEMKLIDSESARYKFPKQPVLQSGLGGKQYTVPFAVNAKNRLGGYTGFKPYRAFFINGEVQRANESPFDVINLR